jgi:type III secretion system YscJ/HrcJ family lipoprotein
VRARALAVCAVLAGCSSEIARNLDERQSREVMASLGRAGIAAEREAGSGGASYAITVASGDASRAMAVLEADGLPRATEKGLAGLYGSASMIPTATEEKARYVDALGSEIALHLRNLEGVLDASVIITAPARDPLAPPDQPQPKATASVLVRIPAEAVPVNEANVRKLVAGAVEGLAADDVTVVMTQAPPAPAGGGASYAKVGPIHVAPSSKTPLQLVLAAAFALVIGLGAWAFLAERRRRHALRGISAQ